MPQYTSEEYTAFLTRTYVTRFSRENRPRTVTDVTDKGEEVLEFILPHSEDGRFSVSLQAHIRRGYVSDCALFFGQAEVADRLDPEEAVAAINEVIEDRIIAVVRYKNREAYDNRRKAAEPSEWLYQTPDEEDDLSRMLEKLKKPVTFLEKVGGKYTGVFEVYRWSGVEVIDRT
jgi:hypothetical protein